MGWGRHRRIDQSPANRVAYRGVYSLGVRPGPAVDGKRVPVIRRIHGPSPDVQHQNPVGWRPFTRINYEGAGKLLPLVIFFRIVLAEDRPVEVGARLSRCEGDAANFSGAENQAVVACGWPSEQAVHRDGGVGKCVPHRRTDDRSRLHPDERTRDLRSIASPRRTRPLRPRVRCQLPAATRPS